MKVVVWWFTFLVMQIDGTGGFLLTSRHWETRQICEEKRGVMIEGLSTGLMSWEVRECVEGELEQP